MSRRQIICSHQSPSVTTHIAQSYVAYVKGRTRLGPLRSTTLAKNCTTGRFDRSVADWAFANATSILDLLNWQCCAAVEIRNKQMNEH